VATIVNTNPEVSHGASAPEQLPYRQGFESLKDEIDLARLPIEGQVPPWLAGTLVRTGPARFEVGGQNYKHWFDGLAMLHCFSFADGAVAYRNRFLHSKAYEAAKTEGRIAYSEFATDPCRSIFKRVTSIFDPHITDNGNVNVSRIAGHFVAMTETPLPIEFDRETLDTVGVFDYDGDAMKVHHTTAHPHYDPANREAFNYFAHFSRVSSYNAYRVVGDSGRRQVFGQKSVSQPGYIHSFGLTEKYFVLVEFPYVVNPLELIFSGRPFIENFKWKPERPARFYVFRRSDGGLQAEVEADPFFAFHHVNAFEDGDTLKVDIVAYDDAAVVKSLYLDVLRAGDRSDFAYGKLRRYSVPLGGGAATHSMISDEPVELPRINYRLNGRDYGVAYFAGADPARPRDFLSRLVKVDVRSGASQSWSDEGCYPGEAVFVASPGAASEDDGVLLSVVLDARQNTSFLLVLDAKSFTEIARASVPHHIPFGFHGQYFS
jgi:carotenoid cleavage dioxygenase-like enzyme